MAVPLTRWFARSGGHSLRHAIAALGGLSIPWLVVRTSSMEVWGGMVTFLILVQLSAHVAQWGSRDLLQRAFHERPGDVVELWRTSLFTRSPIWLSVLALLCLLPSPDRPGMLLWSGALILASGLEPLVIRNKHFQQAARADILGLLAQVALLLSAGTVDGTVVVRSFAFHQAVRAVGLWLACGRPSLSWKGLRPEPALHLRAALPFVGVGLAGLLATRIDLYVADAVLPVEQAGEYQILAALFVQFQILPGLLAIPMTRELYRLDDHRLLAGARRLGVLGLLLTAPFLIALHLLLPPLFGIGATWTVLLAGALAAWPSYVYVPCYILLYREHQERYAMVLCFIAAASIALCAWLLLPGLGLAGGLLGSALGQWIILVGVLARTRGLLNDTQRTRP